MDMQLQRQRYVELRAKRSKSLADKLVEWQQQQRQEIQEEPGNAQSVYQDKVARLRRRVNQTPGSKGQLKLLHTLSSSATNLWVM